MMYGTGEIGYQLSNPTWQAKTLILCREIVNEILNSHFDNNTIKNLESLDDLLRQLIEDSQDEE